MRKRARQTIEGGKEREGGRRKGGKEDAPRSGREEET